jgi:tripartite-type tricarboxylate transporter receptor subunit TctC
MPTERSSRALCTLAVCTFAAGAACAQTYPSKPVRIVVGVPPGGTTDVVARLVGQKIGEQVGQQVLIDNRGGAGGNIGAELVAKSPADGYTLFLATIGTMTINPHLYRKMPFDTLKDFAAVSQLTSMPQVLAVHPSIPAKTLPDLVALGKAHPDRLNFASGGSGTAIHLAGELFKSMTGVKMEHVPYKGSAPAMTDLISGQVSLMFDQIVTAMPHVQNGRLRALGVTTSRRSPIAPNLPTLAESGLPGYEITTWHGLLAPAGTPRETVARLAAEAAKALQAADVREKFASQGVDPVSSTPEQFAAFMKSELDKWGKVVKASGARID